MPVGQAPKRRGPPWPPHNEEIVSDPRRAVGCASLLLALVLLGAFFVPAGPLALDSRWSELMQDVETSFLTHLALISNALGHGVWRALTVAGIGIALLVARRWAALIAFALTEALTPMLVNLIKLAVDRERPPGSMLDAHGTSYPSGHAAYAGATAVAVVFLLSAPGPRRRLFFVPAAVAIAVMVWSRTYLQVHWLSDAVAGATLGVAATLACFAGVQIFLDRASGRHQ